MIDYLQIKKIKKIRNINLEKGKKIGQTRQNF